MGTLLVVLLIVVAGWILWKLFKTPDINHDGKVDANDVVAAAKEVVAETKAEAVKVADVVTEKVKKGRKPKKPKAE